MTAPDQSAVWLHTPAGRFRVQPQEAHDLVERLRAAAASGEALVVRLLVPDVGAGEDAVEHEGAVVVAPGTTVALTGPRRAFDPPAEGNPVW
jgi:hypothetical protein